MKKLLIFLYLFVTAFCFGGCIKTPSIKTYATVNYSFSGGDDFLSVFDLTATYLGSDLTMISEPIPALPWKQTQVISTPCEAKFDITFKAKGAIPDAEFYKMGFSGDITYEYLNDYPVTKSSNSENDVLSFKVVFNNGDDAQKAVLTIPILKYDKHFVYSYTADDAVVGAYARFWRRVNGKWIDDIELFHKHCTKTTGYYPKNTLGITDGCGNERRFPVGVAIWPNHYTQYMPNGIMADTCVSPYVIYIAWDEMRDIIDFGGAAFYHNVDETKYSFEDPAAIQRGFDEDRVKTFNKLGRNMKVLALPDGKIPYLTAADGYDYITMIRTDTRAPKIHMKDASSLYKGHLYNGFSEDKEKLLNELKQQSLSDDPYWISFSSHRLDTTMIPFFEKINDLYGKDGEDNMWFATIEEVYEYVMMKNSATIEKEVSGETATFHITIPKNNNFYYKDLSFVVDNVSSCSSIEPLSDNIVGLFSGVKEEKLLINVNFNENSLVLAEKYTRIYESNYLEEAKSDALYFTTFLTPDLAEPFLNRINNAEKGVRLDSIVIDDGKNITYTQKISVSLKYSNTPTQYKLWEKGVNEGGVSWSPFSGSPVSFILSEAYGAKEVYARLKNEYGESKAVSSQITLKKLDEGIILKENIGGYIDEYNGFVFSKAVQVR